MNRNSSIDSILSSFNKQQLNKITDFLISEIDTDNLEETIHFVRSSDAEKRTEYKDILYTEDNYEGLFIEGNQYLIGSNRSNAFIIDIVSEEHGVDKAFTRVSIAIEDFIYLIKNKKEVLTYKSK